MGSMLLLPASWRRLGGMGDQPKRILACPRPCRARPVGGRGRAGWRYENGSTLDPVHQLL